MYVAHLTLVDFRSYATAEVPLEPGATAFIGRNGQGKTNLVEAIDYLSRLSSHRVAADAPLVRAGADRALVRAAVVRDGRQAVLEVEIHPGKANRARVNRADLPRARLARPGLSSTSSTACRPSFTTAARTTACSAPLRTRGASVATRCEVSRDR